MTREGIRDAAVAIVRRYAPGAASAEEKAAFALDIIAIVDKAVQDERADFIAELDKIKDSIA